MTKAKGADNAGKQRAARNGGPATLDRISDTLRSAFETDQVLLSFDEFVDLAAQHPRRFARNSVQYLLDAFDHFGVEEIVTGRGEVERHTLFDAPFDDGHERVVGNEATQAELIRTLKHFVRERRINRLILVHGPNGSAKSSLVSCLMRAMQAFSHCDEGALYRFNWVFPAATLDSGRIGFDAAKAAGVPKNGSYAYLEERLIDSKLPSEHHDNPLFLLPPDARLEFLEAAFADDKEFVLSDTIRRGDLGHRSRAVFDALLASYRGDYAEVLRHVQVERFYISKRYRRGAVTVEPQLRVDASSRQLTVDRSLNALPQVLQSQTMFEAFGPLVEGNRGVVEYNDFFKRPMEANKYLLSTSEKGTVSLETGEIHIDTLLIATANEKYLEAFKQQPDWASYKGRFSLVRMPYLLDFRAEQQIYDAQLAALQLAKPVAPHTTFVAALWAVLTRLRKPNKEGFDASIAETIQSMSPLQKALLYADGTMPQGLSAEQSQQLKIAVPELMAEAASRSDYEGRHGASPREIKTVVLDAAHQDAGTLSPLHIFGALKRLIADDSVYEWLRIEPEGDYHKVEEFIDVVKHVYLDRVEREVRDATGLVDPDEYAKLFERYITHANASLRKEKLKDDITGQMRPPDEGFMGEIENTLGREEEAPQFRSHLISRIAAFRIDHRDEAVDLERIFPDYFERMREHYYGTKRVALRRIKENLLAFADDSDALNAEERSVVQGTLDRLADRFGYTLETAKEAISLLLRERYETESN